MLQLRFRLFIIILQILFFGFYSNSVLSQIKVEGVIKDTLGKPIPSAFVSLIYLETGAGFSFTKSNPNGEFKILVNTQNKHVPVAIKIVALGYLIFKKEISENEKYSTFILQNEVRYLPPVSVKNSRTGLRIKGDTLSYSASEFSDKSDRVIGDVIKRIPGIEVEENGTIKYFGKSINNFYIDGDNLLDDKYSIATNNIPASFVDRIQVIEHNQHIKMLNGIVPSDRAALNITLNDKARLNFVNSSKLGLGSTNAKELEVNSLAFKSKFKAINNIKYNSSGNDIGQELISHNQGDIIVNSDNSGIEKLLGVSLSEKPDVKDDRFLVNNAILFGINDFFKFRNELSLRVNASYLSDKQNQIYSYNRSYYLPGDTINYFENQNLNEKINNIHTLFTANINTEKKYVNNAILIDIDKLNDNSIVNNGGVSISQELKGNIQKFTNNFSTVLVMAKNRYLDISSFFSYETKPQNLSVSPGLQPSLLNNNLPYNISLQNANIPTFYTNNSVSYKLNSRHLFQNYRAGFILQEADVISDLSILTVNNVYHSLPDSFTNQLHWLKYKSFIEGDYRWELGKNTFGLTLPLNYLKINYLDTKTQVKDQIGNLFILPSIRWKILFGEENTFSLGYKYLVDLNNVNEVFQGVVMNNYESFVSNNLPLQQTKSNVYNFSLDVRRAAKMFSINVFGTYSQKSSDYLYSYTLENQIMRKDAVLIPNVSYREFVSMIISKYLFKISSSVYLRYSYQNNTNEMVQNGVLFNSSNNSHSVLFGLNSKFSKVGNISYETNFILNNNEQVDKNLEKTSSQTELQMKGQLGFVLFISRKISFNSRNELYFNNQYAGNKSQNIFNDISFRFSLKKGANIDLLCNNIFNTTRYFTTNLSSNSIATSNFQLRPRMLLIRASFNFK